MGNMIDIEYSKECNVSFDELNKLQIQIETNLRESRLFEKPGTCGKIKIILNPKLSSYANVQSMVKENMYWIFGDENVKIDAKKWRNFQLRCLHLDIPKEVARVLLILLSESVKSEGALQPENKPSHENNDDEDSLPSFIAVEPTYTLDKVVMTDQVRRQVQRSIALIRGRKKIFEEWGFAEVDPHTKTILCFYGPPGTGKTMCAHAICAELGKKIILASYASIESKWVGEGPKNLQKIFKNAQEQDAVLFFDEADSFLSKRVGNAETGSDKHYNRMSNEMFQLLENFDGIVIFATNMVADFDKAFKSRILAFVEFERPDQKARKLLIKKMIPKKLPLLSALTEEELDTLAEIGDGFSGREIRKSILTTLANAALEGVCYFTVREFEIGFRSVKEETESIEKSRSGEGGISGDLIQDFIAENTTNQYIMEACLKTAWRSEKLDAAMKKQLCSIAKALNLELPDLSISYRNKNLQEAIKNISDNNRMTECLKYCCDILALEALQNDEDELFLEELPFDFQVKEKDCYMNYFRSVKQFYNNVNI